MSLRRAASQLTFERPPQVLCTTRNNVQMLISIFIPCMAYLGMEKYLQRHDFWQNRLPDTSVSYTATAFLPVYRICKVVRLLNSNCKSCLVHVKLEV